MRKAFALLASAVAALAFAGCSAPSENEAPILDSVDAPLVVAKRNGQYRIPLTVLFHDNDGEAITSVRYRVSPNIEGTTDVPAPNPTRQSAQLTIVIDADSLEISEVNSTDDDDRQSAHGKEKPSAKKAAGAAPRTMHISLIDSRGAESLSMVRQLTLE